MGTVYKAFDPHIHRPVAIKTIHRELLGDSTATDSIAARFRNEAKAVGRIAHPGVVAIYDFGEDGDVTFIAMEYVDGRTLDAILAVPQMLSESNVLAVMDQLLDALSVAHAQGYVWHRDIKPANLIVTKDGPGQAHRLPGIARLEDANLTQGGVVDDRHARPTWRPSSSPAGAPRPPRRPVRLRHAAVSACSPGRRAFTGATEQVMYKILNENAAGASSVVTHGAASRERVRRDRGARDGQGPGPALPRTRRRCAQRCRRSRARHHGSAPGKATVILPLPLPLPPMRRDPGRRVAQRRGKSPSPSPRRARCPGGAVG